MRDDIAIDGVFEMTLTYLDDPRELLADGAITVEPTAELEVLDEMVELLVVDLLLAFDETGELFTDELDLRDVAEVAWELTVLDEMAEIFVFEPMLACVEVGEFFTDELIFLDVAVLDRVLEILEELAALEIMLLWEDT